MLDVSPTGAIIIISKSIWLFLHTLSETAFKIFLWKWSSHISFEKKPCCQFYHFAELIGHFVSSFPICPSKSFNFVLTLSFWKWSVWVETNFEGYDAVSEH